MNYREHWGEWFRFSKRERQGIWAISFLLSILSVAVVVQHYRYDAPSIDILTPPLTSYQFLTSDSVDISESFNHQDAFNSSLLSYYFHPDTLTIEHWKALGFSEKESRMIVRFKEVGGGFKNETHFLKLKCITEEKWVTLKDRIQWQQGEQKKDSLIKNIAQPPANKSFTYKVDLNKADSLELDLLPGISPKMAASIVKYRDRLGGFISTEQLKELKFISDEKWNLIQDHVYVDGSSPIKKLNMNVIQLEELLRFPYLSHNQARFIINYREQHGWYHSKGDLKQLILMDDLTFAKISPYVDLP